MTSPDEEEFRRLIARAEEEFARAASTHGAAAEAHRRLAEAYLGRVGKGPVRDNPLQPFSCPRGAVVCFGTPPAVQKQWANLMVALAERR